MVSHNLKICQNFVWTKFFLTFLGGWHGVKVGPGPWDPRTRDTLQSLKVEPQDPVQSLKVGPPHLSLMNSFFSEYFIFLNINCE